VDSRYIPFERPCANCGPNDYSSEELTYEIIAVAESQTGDFIIIIVFAGKGHPQIRGQPPGGSVPRAARSFSTQFCRKNKQIQVGKVEHELMSYKGGPVERFGC
jgi:hypothetical protein